ncbi:hypothetical protein AMATHDRAFT_76902 [Amanita thiersii Skay4041]|uniref:Snurportin-1 n=1 Tax=Amanita thiersii Skay4041 TaxID=703135 RepID=A0A2A9NK81_9AGAR|nr:hypothetical protein AMATHDRAFT_76902 [Amanita thiersii Skay4041]
MFSTRKATFKLPPTIIQDPLISQEARRLKALEEQKRRRAQKFDSTRQLDVFADLTLNGSDDEEGDAEDAVTMSPSTGVAAFLPAMQQTTPPTESPSIPHSLVHAEPTSPPKKKSKKKRRGGKNANKPSKWADKCMYAELLEMVDPGLSEFNLGGAPSWDTDGNFVIDDRLPKDLETHWVAVAPVPVGKRCLAVTHQSSGTAGVAPNTTLRSRLLGKTLIARFPSSLPPLTILDCILDANWKDNGILHVLDVIKWKGQDVGDCEAPFRFWWRDTRLAELAQSTAGYQATVPVPMVSVPVNSQHSVHPPNDTSFRTPNSPSKYQFSYPMTFLPIPYHTDTSYSALCESIVPAARSIRRVEINVPLFVQQPSAIAAPLNTDVEDGDMDVDVAISQPPAQSTFSFSFANGTNKEQNLQPAASSTPSTTAVTSVNMTTSIQPDGLLLYVAEASYEAGTSPLSSWVPIFGYEKKISEERECMKKGGNKIKNTSSKRLEDGQREGPLALFER